MDQDGVDFPGREKLVAAITTRRVCQNVHDALPPENTFPTLLAAEGLLPAAGRATSVVSLARAAPSRSRVTAGVGGPPARPDGQPGHRTVARSRPGPRAE